MKNIDRANKNKTFSEMNIQFYENEEPKIKVPESTGVLPVVNNKNLVEEAKEEVIAELEVNNKASKEDLANINKLVNIYNKRKIE